MNTEQSAYWHTVQETMVTFHGIDRDAAKAKIERYRVALLETGDVLALELATHEEPFYLATQLAGRKVVEPTASQAKVYAQIMKRCTEEAVAFGAMDELFQETKQRLIQIESKAKGVLRRKQSAESRRQKLAVSA